MTGAAAQSCELVDSTTLVFHRTGRDEPADAFTLLGGRLVGPSPGGSAAQCAKTGTPVFVHELLSPETAVLDGWYSQSAAEVEVEVEVVQHQHGCVNYASDGHWLHGWAEVDETSFEGGIHAAAQRASMAPALGRVPRRAGFGLDAEHLRQGEVVINDEYATLHDRPSRSVGTDLRIITHPPGPPRRRGWRTCGTPCPENDSSSPRRPYRRVAGDTKLRENLREKRHIVRPPMPIMKGRWRPSPPGRTPFACAGGVSWATTWVVA